MKNLKINILVFLLKNVINSEKVHRLVRRNLYILRFAYNFCKENKTMYVFIHFWLGTQKLMQT